MNRLACEPVTRLNYRRLRREALDEGPSDDSIDLAREELEADDATIADAFGSLDAAAYAVLDKLMGAAYRSGQWSAFGLALTDYIRKDLQERAVAIAETEQVAAWDDYEGDGE